MNEGDLARRMEKAERWAGRAGTNPSQPWRFFQRKRRLIKKQQTALDRYTDAVGYAIEKGYVPF